MNNCEGCKELVANMSYMLGYTSKSWTGEERKFYWDLITKWDKKDQPKCNCKCHDDGCNCSLLHPELHTKKPDPVEEKVRNIWVSCSKDEGVKRIMELFKP
jgi:hypothetical protein